MKTILRPIGIVCAALVMLSCSKGDPEANFAVKDKNSSNKATASYSYTEAKISISDIDFDFEKEAGTDNEKELEGNYTFNILTGEASNGNTTVEIAAGTYKELEYEMTAQLSGGNSMIVKGTATDGNGSYDFEYASSMEGEYEVESNGETANEGDNVDFVLFIDLDAMFTGVDFANAVVDSDNVIRINENSNEALRLIIEGNLASSLEFDSE